MRLLETEREILHGHLFCGIGGGAIGFNRGQARVGNVRAKFTCVGGIDSDPAVCLDFTSKVGTMATCLDLFSLEQYQAFHGKMPPPTWREATPNDVRLAFGNRRPNIVFLSAPCKGFSGLLSEKSSLSPKYQALNGLTLRGVWLTLEAFKDDPVELIIFENVPRIANRGGELLARIGALYDAYGYAHANTTHDCGELGDLAQSRKRFLKVARHKEKVPPFLYEPDKHKLRGVGEILERLPMPLSGLGGPMHRMPSLQWKTWVRLAFVRAGGDWRSLNDLAVQDGVLRDYGIVPGTVWHGGALGVMGWDETSGTVTSRSGPTNGRHAVSDPRLESGRATRLGVKDWKEPSGVVSGESHPSNGPFAVADPRPTHGPNAHTTKHSVQQWDEPSKVVTGTDRVGSGALCVADPRTGFSDSTHTNILKVTNWDEPSRTVTGSNHPSGGAGSVADKRAADRYGVLRFDEPARAVTGHGQHDNGFNSVADERVSQIPASNEDEKSVALPNPTDRLIAVIFALDGTWHRPFTTLELAALQGLVDPEEQFELEGLSDASWRERIGNCVPPPSAQAIAGVMGETLLLAWSGQTFQLSNSPIWVRNVAVALSVRPEEPIKESN